MILFRMWHRNSSSNPPEIERKLTEMAILNCARIQKWLSSHDQSHQLFAHMKIAAATLSGKIQKMSLVTLKELESFLENTFDKPRITMKINLCSDDEDEDVGGKSPSRNAEQFSVMTPVTKNVEKSTNAQIIEVIEDNETTEINEAPVVVLSDSEINTRHHSASPPQFTNLSLAESLSATPSKKTAFPTRRMSTNSRPAFAQPSIASYQIKTQVLVKPSIYAKATNETHERKIITVPYKSSMHKINTTTYDPKEEAVKLKGIKERIYEKNYLNIDAATKKEMLKTKQCEEPSDIDKTDGSSDLTDDEPKSKNTHRQTATNENENMQQKKNAKSTARESKIKGKSKLNRSKSECQKKKPTKLMSKTIAASKEIQKGTKAPKTKPDPVKPKRGRGRPRRIPLPNILSDDEAGYEPPSHVYDDIEENLRALHDGEPANGLTSNWKQSLSVLRASRSKSALVESTISSTSAIAKPPPEPNESSPNIHQNISNEDPCGVAEQQKLTDDSDSENMLVELDVNVKVRRPGRRTILKPKRRRNCVDVRPLKKVKEEPLE